MNALSYFLYCCLPISLKQYFYSLSSRAILECRVRGVEKVALYGGGYIGVEVYTRFKRVGLNVTAWVDIKANTQPFEQFDVRIQPTTDLELLSRDVPVIICSQATIEPMRKECLKRGLSEDRIIAFQ